MTSEQIDTSFTVIGGCIEGGRNKATGYILKETPARNFHPDAVLICYTMGKSGIFTEPLFAGFESRDQSQARREKSNKTKNKLNKR